MKITIRYFNMVELALAMAVLAIGISSILVLFPVGINASTNARANDQVPMIADVVLENIKNIALGPKNADWSTSMANIPTSPPALTEPVANDLVQAIGNLYYLDSSKPAGLFVYLNGVINNNKDAHDFMASVRYWRDPNYSDFQIGTKTATAAALQKVAAAIYVEISWPTDMAYAERLAAGNVRTYRLELFNPDAK